jgi:hypothetical protein
MATQVTGVVFDPRAWLLHELRAPSSSPTVPAAAPVRLVGVVPNPLNPRGVIRWESDLTTRDRLEIFSVDGRRVRAASWESQPAGPRAFAWDGLDASGRACAAGIYLVRVTADGVAAAAPARWELSGKLTLNR